MILLILLFTSEAVIGKDVFPLGYTTHSSLPQSYPSCFTEEITWANVESTGIIPGVDNAFSCQDLCLESPTCSQFTWYTEQAIPFGFTCLLYDDPTTEYHCSNCVSGPKACLCSGSYTCQITDNNFVGQVPHVETELLCQEYCIKTNNCNFYTWLEEEIFPNLCLMLSSCHEKAFNCQTCHSGPADCRNIAVITSTTATVSPTTTTTPMSTTTTTPMATTTTTPAPTTTTTTPAATTTTPNVSCDLPAPQKHGDWFCPPSTETVTCHLECHPGYVSTNATVIFCKQGVWSEAPECITAVALITGSYYRYSSKNTVEIYGRGLHQKLANLPDDRNSHSLQVVDSTILLCGGQYTTTSCLVLTASQQFISHSTTTSSRWFHSSVSMLGQLHLLGGYDSSSKYTTEHLTPPSTTWREGWQLLETTYDACAAKIGPEMLIVTGGGAHLSSVVMYNVTSGDSTQLQNLIYTRWRHGCTFMMDVGTGFKGVIAAGGVGVDSSGSEIYDLTTGEWSSAGKLTREREQGVALVVLGEDILAMGGYGSGSYSSTVDRFNFTLRSWEEAESMLDVRGYHAVTGVPAGAVGIRKD